KVSSAVFSPDGELVVTASQDNTAQLWDVATGTRHGPPLQHQGWVNSAVFSADGKLVVTASQDDTAQVWDVATGNPHAAPLPHRSWVFSAVFSRSEEHTSE